MFPTRLFFTLERNLIWGRFWSPARQPFLSCERAVMQSAKLPCKINCHFHSASSKHLITLTPKIYPFFSKSLSKILSANGLPGLLPMGQVRRQSYLPKPKLYLSRTTGRGLFRALKKYTAIYNRCFPLKKIKSKGYTLYTPWLTEALLKSIKKKCMI